MAQKKKKKKKERKKEREGGREGRKEGKKEGRKEGKKEKKVIKIQNKKLLKIKKRGFPGGTVVENLPASAGDTGSSPGLGRSHMPRSN